MEHLGIFVGTWSRGRFFHHRICRTYETRSNVAWEPPHPQCPGWTFFGCSLRFLGSWVGGTKKRWFFVKSKEEHGWIEKKMAGCFFIPANFWMQSGNTNDVILISKMEHMEEKNGRIFILSQQIPVATVFFVFVLGFCRVNLFET